MHRSAGSRSRPRSARGYRPAPPQGRPDLDPADHDGRAQGPRGDRRASRGRWAPSTASIRRQDLEGTARRGGRAARLRTRSPMSLIIGGGQGGDRARRAACGSSACRRSSSRRTSGAGDSWRKRYKSLCLHDPVWYDHLPYIDFPEELAGVLAQGQDRRLAGNVRQGDGAELLGQRRQPRAPPSIEEEGMDRRRRARRQGGHAAAEAAGARDRHVRQGQSAAASRAWTSSRASSIIRRAHPGPDAYKGKKVVVIGSNNSAHDICAALWEARRRRHDGAARPARISCSPITLMEIGAGRSLFGARGRRRHDDRTRRT